MVSPRSLFTVRVQSVVVKIEEGFLPHYCFHFHIVSVINLSFCSDMNLSVHTLNEILTRLIALQYLWFAEKPISSCPLKCRRNTVIHCLWHLRKRKSLFNNWWGQIAVKSGLPGEVKIELVLPITSGRQCAKLHLENVGTGREFWKKMLGW